MSILKNVEGINSEKLKQARKEKGLKIKDLSQETGLTQATISMLENGKISPNLKTIMVLINILDVSLDWLMDIPMRDMPEIINIYNELNKKNQALLEAIALLIYKNQNIKPILSKVQKK